MARRNSPKQGPARPTVFRKSRQRTRQVRHHDHHTIAQHHHSILINDAGDAIQQGSEIQHARLCLLRAAEEWKNCLCPIQRAEDVHKFHAHLTHRLAARPSRNLRQRSHKPVPHKQHMLVRLLRQQQM